MFNWKRDIYKCPYVEDKNAQETSYSDLIEIKDVRDMLVHDIVKEKEMARAKAKGLSVEKDKIVITAKFLNWTQLIIKAIAHGIANDISKGNVTVK